MERPRDGASAVSCKRRVGQEPASRGVHESAQSEGQPRRLGEKVKFNLFQAVKQNTHTGEIVSASEAVIVF